MTVDPAIPDDVIAGGAAREEPPPTTASSRCSRRRDSAIALAVSAALFAIYSANGDLLPGQDTTPNVYTAVHLLRGRGFSFTAESNPELFQWNLLRGDDVVASLGLWDLDADIEGHSARQLWTAGLLVPDAPYYLAPTVRADPDTGQPLFVSTFGPGTPLAALPVLAAIRPFTGDLRAHPAALWFGAKAAASLLVALSAALVFLAARRWASPASALFLALAYGLGTGVWSTSSQTLWQHAPDAFFIALGAYALVRAHGTLRWSAVAGAAFAAATACRPTSATFAVAAAVYLLRDRRALLAYAAAAAPLGLAIAGYNAYWFGSPLRFGQTVVGDVLALGVTGAADQWHTPLWVGVAGVIVSPSRGLFVFSPFLLAAISGAVIAWRRPEYTALRPLAIAAVIVTLVAGKHYDWWGGWAYGYRHVVDLAPVLVLLVAPALGGILSSRWRRVAFGVLTAWSVGVQVIGAFVYDTSGWNARTAYHVQVATGELLKVPEEEAARLVHERDARIVGREPMEIAQPQWRHRLWSIRDNQIAYYLARAGSARERRRRLAESWISQWQPPPGWETR